MDHVPPFGIEDIFNFWIFKFIDYDRQKVASYKTFKDYGLYQDGYIEEPMVTEVQSHFVFLRESLTNYGNRDQAERKVVLALVCD